MLPLYLLTNAKGQQMSIELKNGEVVEGELTNVDNWMNVTLSNASQFDNIGSTVSSNACKEIVKAKEVYIRGTYVKYIRLQDEIIDQVKQQINSNSSSNANYGSGSYRGRRSGFNSPGSGSGNYNRRNNPNFGGKRNFNNNPNGQRRPFNNQSRPNTNGMGGYVQQHQQRDVEF
ncbi:RNA processing protein [Zygosaccharomyces mellis]|uniref:LSM complex subunit LSM4 n=1 Tax=Zygosaccharomyces mellis TaxID=42258 RepID=A0A4C2DZN8_9SACH|nr:RNA processing protein [Zygosaccharomyces mellis]